MQTVAGLKENEQLRLIAPFEPAPLYAVLAQRGYAHQSKATPEGGILKYCSREAQPTPPSRKPP
jgi:hypothetical protein